MIDVVQQIKVLVAERRDHEQAVTRIDQQLREIRTALGVGGEVPAKVARQRRSQPTTTTRQARRWTGEGSGTEARILEALAEHEPQSTTELKRIGTTVPQLLKTMVDRGVLFRRAAESNGHGTKPLFWYARSEAAFPREFSADEEAASAIEADAG